MKTHPNILRHTPIDTAPIAARYEQLGAMAIALLDRGMHKAAFEACRKGVRTMNEFCKASFLNDQLELKMDMLCHKYWRRGVLKQLGGQRALKRWFAAMKRCAAREEASAKARPVTPKPSHWRKTREMMAEELRLKAHAQTCAKACAHPRITRDPFKMDADGKFRLPPLPRNCKPRDPDAAWTTPFDITAYRYDGTPVTRFSGYNAPIMVWPAEFEAAELWDYERWLREHWVTPSQIVKPSTLSSRTSVICGANSGDGGSNPKDYTLLLDPGSATLCASVCSANTGSGMTQERAELSIAQDIAQDTADECAV